MTLKRVRFSHQGETHFVLNQLKPYILSFRGAELIEVLRQQQVKLQMKIEEEILLKIKQKMDRIKANQQKLQPSVEGNNIGSWFLIF